MEIEGEVPKTLNKLSMLVNLKKRNASGVSSWLTLMAVSRLSYKDGRFSCILYSADIHDPSSTAAMTLFLSLSVSVSLSVSLSLSLSVSLSLSLSVCACLSVWLSFSLLQF